MTNNIELTLEDRLNRASCISDAISAMAYCIGQTGANLEWENYKSEVFFGFEKLGEVLSKELDSITVMDGGQRYE